MIENKKLRIIDAADLLSIPYENAKAIYRVYKNEGRFTKKIFKLKKKVTVNPVFAKDSFRSERTQIHKANVSTFKFNFG